MEEAKAGELIASPYRQQEFDRKLEKMLLEDKAKWRENGLNFSKHADIYNMPIKAADVIEQVLERKSRTSSALGKSE